MLVLGYLCMLDDYDIEVHQLDDIVTTQKEQFDEDDIIDDELLLVMATEHFDDEVVDIYDELQNESLVVEQLASHHHLDEQKLDILVIDVSELEVFNS